MKEKHLLPTESIKVVDPIEKELAALSSICNELTVLQGDSQRRIFEFLKSKFRSSWPSTYNE